MKKTAFAAAVMMLVLAFCPVRAEAATVLQGQIPYTYEEQRMMNWVVQQEVRGASVEHKRVIAQVIVNRVKDPAFPDTVTDVLTQKNQFSSIGNWYDRKFEPDRDTITAVRQVLTGEYADIHGALYFYAPRWASPSAAAWFENDLTFLFEMEGHRFFR
ncbi:MAG: cell wall hydrolase [Oscillospiraceae bacterium]|nr:cell wall hydrolase [Oscillospiraceae bacterium]